MIETRIIEQVIEVLELANVEVFGDVRQVLIQEIVRCVAAMGVEALLHICP